MWMLKKSVCLFNLSKIKEYNYFLLVGLWSKLVTLVLNFCWNITKIFKITPNNFQITIQHFQHPCRAVLIRYRRWKEMVTYSTFPLVLVGWRCLFEFFGMDIHAAFRSCSHKIKQPFRASDRPLSKPRLAVL